MSVSGTSSSNLRITGITSGIDTDSIVSQLMAAEKKPLEKLYQKRQLAEWKQEAYREISNALRTFSDKYFDVLKSDNYMLSQSTYKKYAATTSDSSVVTVIGSSTAASGSHKITVQNLATAAVYQSTSGVTKEIAGTSSPDFSAASGKSFVLNVDGSKYTVTIDDTVTDLDSLQTAVDQAVGSGKIKVSDTNGDGSGYLAFSSVTDSGVSKITLSDGTDSALSALGFSSDANLCNQLSTSDTLEACVGKMKNSFDFNADGKLKLSINGVSFEFDKSITLSAMMQEINNSDAGVTMKYNEATDKFMFTAKNTGAGDRIKLSETDSTFLVSAGITDYTPGEDAVIILDGVKITRSSNSITSEGVTYKLISESTEEQTVSLSLDTEGIYNKITSFISDYNALIDTINNKLAEEYDRDYQPLTDDEKEAMSEDDIELWEKKAKTGLLRNDSILESIVDNMRSALYQSVSGVSTTLSEIGISTGDYSSKGKLYVDADTLKEAINNNPDQVMNLFSKASTSYPGTTSARTLDSTEREIRNSEQGLVYRLYDILQDNISTYRNSSGKKGTLLEKAGWENDASVYSNTLTSQITEYEEDIDEMLDKLADKEDYYYSKFTAMESYISQMNSQLSSFQSQMG